MLGKTILFAEHVQIFRGDGFARFVFLVGFLLPLEIVAMFVAAQAIGVELDEDLEEPDQFVGILAGFGGEFLEVEAAEGVVKFLGDDTHAGVVKDGIARSGLLLGEFMFVMAVVEAFLGGEPVLVAALAPTGEARICDGAVPLLAQPEAASAAVVA